MNNLFKALALNLFLVAAAIIIFIGRQSQQSQSPPPPLADRVITKSISNGDTFVKLASEAGIATDTAIVLINSAKNIYDLASIRSGRELAFLFDATSDVFKKLVYQVDNDRELIIERQLNGSSTPDIWRAELSTIPYEIKEKTIAANITSSLYETFLENQWDVRLALAIAEIFAWQIDFAADIQKGDSFKIVYEERYRNGQYVMPGKILAAQFVNSGEVFKAFWFKGQGTAEGYYDENGNSLQKVFLKSPLQYKYISSGFSYARYDPIRKIVSPHRGIDYAANAGTPAVAVGDGIVTQAGWNGYYGISVTIRHNDIYTTVYGHFQSLARGIKSGARVKQGQIIGYVGSTGLATGPHLHYEMHKLGAYVNPFKVVIPPGEPIQDVDKSLFEETIKKYQL